MAKILQFRLPDLGASGNVSSETLISKTERLIGKPPKEPIEISVMPDKGFPIGHKDFRPFLQRDGLILLSWARWEDYDETLTRYYVVNWITSTGKGRHYASRMITEQEIAEAAPARVGDSHFHRGIYGRYTHLTHVPAKDIADYLYLVAPLDLSLDKRFIPGFIQELRAAGVTVDFDYPFSMDREKKIRFAEEYLKTAQAYAQGEKNDG